MVIYRSYIDRVNASKSIYFGTVEEFTDFILHLELIDKLSFIRIYIQSKISHNYNKVV